MLVRRWCCIDHALQGRGVVGSSQMVLFAVPCVGYLLRAEVAVNEIYIGDHFRVSRVSRVSRASRDICQGLAVLEGRYDCVRLRNMARVHLDNACACRSFATP